MLKKKALSQSGVPGNRHQRGAAKEPFSRVVKETECVKAGDLAQKVPSSRIQGNIMYFDCSTRRIRINDALPARD